MNTPLENENNQSTEKVTIDALEKLGFDVIEDMPWAQDLWRDVEEHTKRGFLHWCRIVKSVAGTKENHIQEWGKLYVQHVDELLCDMVLEFLMMQKSTIDKIQELFKQLQKLCLELQQPMPKKIGEKKLSLYEEQMQLMKQVQECEVVVNAKKQELQALHEKQQRVCKHLGRQPKITLQYSPLPTLEQLEEFRKHIDQLEAEKFEREERYCLLKHEIVQYVDELKYKPNCDFERKVLSSDHFFVTNDNMEKLEFFAKCLKEVKKSTEEEISQFRSKVEDLWKMLDVDLRDRDQFRTHYTGNSLDTLDRLRSEIKRCEEIRKTNIKSFVEKLRAELESLWKTCHCSDIAKRSFKYMHNECYTEDLLEIHELEIQKWKKYYEENSRLLGLLEKHEELWKKEMELEQKSTDPNRYKNRGGKLLQEEKERNALSKLIPKIEEEIRALSEEYKQKNNTSFFSFGQTPEDYLEHMHAERENNRKLKLSARKMQRDNTLARTPGKSAISLFPSSSTAVTPTPATKRKILATPNENLKRLRMNTPRNVSSKSKTTARTLPKIKVTYTPMTLPSQKRKSRSSLDQSISRRSTRKSRSHEKGRRIATETDVTMSSYLDFQSDLSSRKRARSTLLPDPSLQNTPTGAHMREKRAAGDPLFKTPSKIPSQYKRTPFKT